MCDFEHFMRAPAFSHYVFTIESAFLQVSGSGGGGITTSFFTFTLRIQYFMEYDVSICIKIRYKIYF